MGVSLAYIKQYIAKVSVCQAHSGYFSIFWGEGAREKMPYHPIWNNVWVEMVFAYILTLTEQSLYDIIKVLGINYGCKFGC